MKKRKIKKNTRELEKKHLAYLFSLADVLCYSSLHLLEKTMKNPIKLILYHNQYFYSGSANSSYHKRLIWHEFEKSLDNQSDPDPPPPFQRRVSLYLGLSLHIWITLNLAQQLSNCFPIYFNCR